MTEKKINYHQSFTPKKFVYLYAQLAIYFSKHYIFRQYRKSIPSINYVEYKVAAQQRRRESLYDAIFNILLDGYTEITGFELLPSTGQMLFFLRQFARSFDDYFEKHLENGLSLDFWDILSEPAVKERQNSLQDFINLHTSSTPIFSYLRNLFVNHYTEFLKTFDQAQKNTDFSNTLKVIEFDSGFWLEAMIQCVAMFNHREFTNEARQNFYFLGIAGKLGDEIVDIKRDIKSKSPNILLAILNEIPDELKMIQSGIENRAKLNKVWWLENCPKTYIKYFALIETYYEQITSEKLRLACDLMIMPSITGYDYENNTVHLIPDFNKTRIKIRKQAYYYVGKQISKISLNSFFEIQSRIPKLTFHQKSQKSYFPSAIQESTLKGIIHTNKGTWFGKKHNFQKISTIRDYQTAIPIQAYKDIESCVERISNGEPEVLTREFVDFMQLTSGTTSGKQKFIPTTSGSRRKISYETLRSLSFLNKEIEKGMVIIGRPDGITPGGIPYGTVSVNYTQNAKGIWEWFSVVPFEVSLITNPFAKIYSYWRFALLNENLNFISAIYMPTLLLYAQTLLGSSHDLIKDIYDGSITSSVDISPKIRETLKERLSPSPKRANILESIARKNGGLNPKYVWNKLSLMITALGPTQQIYESQIKDYFDFKVIWGAPYLAAEGLLGLPFQPNSYSHLPAIKTSFLEFIPESEWLSQNPITCLVSDLEIGEKYEIVLTGSNGIYRIRMSDVILVDGMKNNVPTFQIIARRESTISGVWEKTTENQVVESVIRVERECNIKFVDFVVDVDRHSTPPRYQLWLELGSPISINDPSVLQHSFDRHLRHANPIYAKLRDEDALHLPIIIFLPSGYFHKYKEMRTIKMSSVDEVKVLHAVENWSTDLYSFHQGDHK